MNRKTKRLMAKQEAATERERARQAPLAAGDAKKRRRGVDANGEKREPRRKRWGRFLREVRYELKKVSWPSRTEVVTYTVVVLVSVTVVTVYVFGLDFAFGKMILNLFQ